MFVLVMMKATGGGPGGPLSKTRVRVLPFVREGSCAISPNDRTAHVFYVFLMDSGAAFLTFSNGN